MHSVIKLLFATQLICYIISGLLLFGPEVVGVWEAKKDVAYNAYMELQYPYDETTNQE